MNLLDKKTQSMFAKVAIKNLEDAAECMELINKDLELKILSLNKEIDKYIIK